MPNNLTLETVLSVIEAEEEIDEGIPDDLWGLFQSWIKEGNREQFESALAAIVRLTKDGISERMVRVSAQEQAGYY